MGDFVDCCLPGQSDDYEAVIVVLTIRRFYFHLVRSIYSGSSWPNYCAAFAVALPNFCVPTHCQGYQRDSVGFWRNFETQRQPSVKHTPAESHPFAIIQGDWWYIAAVAETHSLHGEMPKQTTSTHIIVPTSKVPLL